MMRSLRVLAVLGGWATWVAACSGSSEPGASASSSSSSGEPADDGAAADAGSCGFAIEGAGVSCDAAGARCVGSANDAEGTLDLTRSESSVDDGQTGAYWQALSLPRDAAFTLTVQVSTHQPAEGGIQGHGFAFVLVQDDAEPIDFPPVRSESPATMGTNQLDGFHGAAAYVKTYNGGTEGVLALRTTQIPSSNPDQVDDWDGAIGNAERFGRSEANHLRFVLVSRPGADPTVEMIRFDDASFTAGRSIQTVSIPLPAMDRFDYFGVIGVRGNDGYSQSGHRLESLALVCE